MQRIKQALLKFYSDELNVASEALPSISEDASAYHTGSRQSRTRPRALTLLRHPPLPLAVVKGDDENLANFLDLLLGCAVQCAEKEKHITNMQQLDQSVLAVLMASIQRLIGITR